MTGPVPATWAVDPEAAGAREVVPGVWRLRLPTSWPGIDHANAYLVDRDDGVMLVDTGPGGDATNLAALEHAVAATGHVLAEVRALVITHAHSDHLGVAREVLDASDAQLWMHPADGHFHDAIRDPDEIYARRTRRARQEGVPAERLDDFASVQEELQGGAGALVADHPLTEGTTLPSALGDWTVAPAPGHAPSQVLLLQPEHGVALVGDSLCVVFADWMDYGHSADPITEWLQTLDRIEALAPATSLPGHGRPLTDLPAVLATYRDGFAQMLAALRTELAAGGPGTAYALVERLHGPTPDGIEAIGHMTELLCALKHLRERGEVVRVDGDPHTYRAA